MENLKSVLIVGGPDAGKTNYLSKLLLSIYYDKCKLKFDGLPDQLEYVIEKNDYILKGEFVPRTAYDDFSKLNITVKHLVDNDSSKNKLLLPDSSGEQWINVYKMREWSQVWEELMSNSLGCLIFVRVVSDQFVPAVDYIYYEKMFGNAQDIQTTSTEENYLEVPTQVVITDWIQCITSAYNSSKDKHQKYRIGIIATAWDLLPAEQADKSPDIYIEENLPMLMQFLQANESNFEYNIFGVSIVGGDLNMDSEFRNKYLQGDPVNSGYIVYSKGEHVIKDNDISLPVIWAMGSNI